MSNVDLTRLHWYQPLLAGLFAAAFMAGVARGAEPGPLEGALASVKHLHSFEGPEGEKPTSALVYGSDGKLHGVTGFGGEGGAGTAFRMLPNGKLTVLHQFTKKLGPLRPWGLIQGADGDYYGASGGGGEFHNAGTVYRMTAQGDVTVLHSFNYELPEGAYPYAPLLQASDGNLYGTTGSGGGKGEGSVFKVSPDGTGFAVLHRFTRARGDVAVPGLGPLTQGDDGYIYGTAQIGGAHDAGAIYRVSLAGDFEVFHSFRQGTHLGWGASTGLVRAADGHLYGQTGAGGRHDHGTFYRVDTNGVFTVLHRFRPTEGGRVQHLVLARDGNFYGAAGSDGRFGKGYVYRLSPQGEFTRLHSFGTPGTLEGYAPVGGLVEGADGDFYGMTQQGGTHALGTVYRLRLKQGAD